MSSTAYSLLKSAIQSLLDRNLEPTLEAFQYYFPDVVNDELDYASVIKQADLLKHKYIEEQRKIGIDVVLVPFERPEIDTATHKNSRKRAANRVSPPPGNEDTSNALRRGCNDNGERRVMEVVLGSALEGECDRECIAMEDSKRASGILTIGNKRKMRKISLDSSTVSFPTHESIEEASIAPNKADDKESSSESRGNDSNNEVLDTTMSILPIEKRETHMLTSNLGESVEATANNLGIQKGAQSQGNSNVEVDTILFPFSSEQRNNETLRGTLTVFPYDQEAETGVRSVTPADDEQSLGSRTSTGSIHSHNTTEMTNDDLSDPSFLLRKESAKSTLSTNDSDEQLGTLINDPMIHSKKDEERNMNADSNQQQKSASSISNSQHSEFSFKPIHFKKANDKEGFMKVKEIIEGMTDEGIQHPASDFYEKYPELTSKYEKRSLSVGIGNFVSAYKAKKAATEWKSNYKTANTNQQMQQYHLQQSMPSYQQAAATYHVVPPMQNPVPAPFPVTRYGGNLSIIGHSVMSNFPYVELPVKPIHFKKANDAEGYLQVKEIIRGMVDEGIQYPASKFYEKYPELTSKYEKSSLSKAIFDFSSRYKAKKNASGSKDSSFTVHDDASKHHHIEVQNASLQNEAQTQSSFDAAMELNEERTVPGRLNTLLKFGQLLNIHDQAVTQSSCDAEVGKTNVSENMPPLKQAKKSKKKKKHQVAQVDTDIQPNLNLQNVEIDLDDPSTLAQFMGESELVDVNDRQYIPDYIFLSMAQLKPCYVTQLDRIGTYSYKTRQIGFKGMCCKHCGGEPGFGRYFPETLRSLSQTTTSQTIVKHIAYKCRKAPKEIQNSVRALKELQEQKGELAKQYQRSRFEERPKYGSRKVFFQRLWGRLHEEDSATLPKEREESHGIAGRSIQPNHTNAEFHFTNKAIEEQDTIISMIKLATTKTTNSPQRLASTSTAVMNEIDVQGDATSTRNSTNMEQIFKPIHFKKSNGEVGFLKIKDIINGMMDEGVEDPQKEFFQKYPSLANKYTKDSIRLGVHSFCKGYKIKKANEEKKKKSLLLLKEKQEMLRVVAKNGLENYCYSLKTSISSPEVEGKVQADDKAKLEGAIDETLQWLDSNLSAEKEEFEEKQKALEAIAAPLFEYLKALETEKCVDNEEQKSTNQCTSIDEIAVSEQSKPIQTTDFDKFLENKATLLAEWICGEVIKFNSANVRLECKEYAEELIKLGFYDKEMMKNFCTVQIVDSEDYTSFMKLAHRLSLKKWLLEHGTSK